jgi:hypothetical protein
LVRNPVSIKHLGESRILREEYVKIYTEGGGSAKVDWSRFITYQVLESNLLLENVSSLIGVCTASLPFNVF